VRDASADEIEAAIGHTRAELGRTLDALERKLAARRLLQEGIAMVTELFGAEGSGRSALVEIARANPIPLALIGAGIGWLVASNTGLLDRIARDERVRGAVRQITDLAGTTGQAREGQTTGAGGWVHRAAGAARGAIGAVRDTGSAVIERTTAYRDLAEERTAQWRETGQMAVERAGEQAARVADEAAAAWQRHALLVGVVSLFAGAIVAAMLPLTRIETK
jgi:hypothetical protein